MTLLTVTTKVAVRDPRVIEPDLNCVLRSPSFVSKTILSSVAFVTQMRPEEARNANELFRARGYDGSIETEPRHRQRTLVSAVSIGLLDCIPVH